jgi:hypothetical protein
VATLNSERFCDQAPAQVWATLLDNGVYLCSISTMYRLLRARHQIRERGRVAPPTDLLKGPTVTGAGGTSCKPRPRRGPWSFWMRSVCTELGSGDQGQLPPASSRRSPESLARYAPQGYRRPCRLVWAVLGGTARLSHSNTRPPSSQTSDPTGAYHLYEFLYSSEEPRRGRCGVGARCRRFSSPR